MTREDIIKLAREAGFAHSWSEAAGEALERFAALVAAHEREACAKVCADLAANRDLGSYGMMVAHTCANDILARGQA